MKRIILSSLLLISIFGYSQEPVIEWQKSLGGSENDYAYSILQTTDGGYIVTGCSISNNGDITGNNGFYDYWIIKLDASGNITWQNSIGGSKNEYARSIRQTTDDGYIVVGDSKSNDGDVTGNNDFNKVWILKLDPSGNITWQNSIGGTQGDHAYSIQQTTDGGYIIGGDSESNDGDVTGNNGGRDSWIVKLDASGNIAWQKSIGGSGYDLALSIQQTTDGGYVFAGISDSNDGDVTGNNGNQDYWVVKLDPSGNITWQTSLGGSGDDSAGSIQQTTDGGYIVAGASDSNNGDITGNHGNQDYWVVKLDQSGNIDSQTSLGGSGDDSARSIQQTTNGGFIVAGSSVSNDGDVTGNNGSHDYWVVKLSPETSSIIENNTLKFNLYPNPTTEKLTISSNKLINSSFKMIDVQGREVLAGKMDGKEYSIDIANLTKGSYSIVFDDSELPILSVIKE